MNNLTKKIFRFNFTIFSINNVNKRVFSDTACKYMDKQDSVSSKIDSILAKSKAFNTSTNELAESLKNKTKFETLNKNEDKSAMEFVNRYYHYLKNEDHKEVHKILDQAGRMDKLIAQKFHSIDLTTDENVKEGIKVIDLTSTSHTKYFNKLNDLIKSNVDNKLANGSISQAEADIFHIQLGKRIQNRETFLNFQEAHLKKISDKIEKAKSNTLDIAKPTVKGETSSDVTNADFSSLANNSVGNKEPVSEEIINIAKEILDLFC